MCTVACARDTHAAYNLPPQAPDLLRLDMIPNNHYNYINGFLVAFMDRGIVPKLMHMPLNCRPYLHGHGHGLGRPLLSYPHSPHLHLGRLWESSDASNLQSLL
jgi:hypothetical protein